MDRQQKQQWRLVGSLSERAAWRPLASAMGMKRHAWPGAPKGIAN